MTQDARSESSIDAAIAAALAGADEEALRRAIAVVEAHPSFAPALLVAGRALVALGAKAPARTALSCAVSRAIAHGQLAVAVAASGLLPATGGDASRALEDVAAAYARGSARLAGGARPPTLPVPAAPSPIDASVAGAALVSRASAAIAGAKRSLDADAAALRTAPLSPQPIFSALGRGPLRALLASFELTGAAAGAEVVTEGSAGDEAWLVAVGELEARRSGADGPVVLGRLGPGALVGEMALVTRAPRAATVVARRPSLLLVARKTALDPIAAAHPEIATVLAEHCRRRMIENLVRTSPILGALRSEDRAALVDQFETRLWEPGARLIVEGEASKGLHLIASGEVRVVRRDGTEQLVLATLGPGEVVGEVGLVLRRPSTADVIAAHPTVTMHLPGERFLDLVRAHPTLLAELYELAVRREDRTRSVLAEQAVTVDDDVLL